ncbi:MAG: hypothetical protein LBD50_04015 [Rickettsiales bacterium]|jgi:hypothetical protein|nr:hypothetical protein [Rickettsiales bacterium]
MGFPKYLYKIAFFACMFAAALFDARAASDDIDSAIQNARNACGDISSEFNDMKKLAGINTAITGVGTLAGGGAIATGFVKKSKDEQAAEIEDALAKLKELEESQTPDELSDVQIQNILSSVSKYQSAHKNDTPAQRQELEDKLAKLNKQSKNLGNWRTGLLAGNTATNIAGAVIASKNKTNGNLDGMLSDCKKSLEDLRRGAMQARIDRNPKYADAQKIVDGCKGYETLDISKINKRADIAKWSSIVGAGVGTAGTITSAVANTDKTRNDNTESGKSKEANLNNAANILSIGATAASASATIFNAAQISAIKKAAGVSDKCQEALQ